MSAVEEITFHAERLDDNIELVEETDADDTGRLSYKLSSTEDGTLNTPIESEPEEAWTWAKENLPTSFAGLKRSSMRLADVVNAWQYIFELEFSGPDSEDDNLPKNDSGSIINPIVSVDTTGKTERMYYSLKTINQYLAKDSALSQVEDYRGAINVGGAGPEGVDKVAPNFAWTEKWYFRAGTVSWDYLCNLGDITGITNKSTFRTRPAESVLFMGAQLSSEADAEYHVVNFNFQYCRGGSEFWVEQIYPYSFEKKGWYYLWVKYLEEVNAQTGYSNKMPQQINVEKVYFDKEFSSNLGIGANLPDTCNLPLSGGLPTPL